ncbi:helix-turn-helix transcriptional regulator [Bacteroides fragilis]
MSLKERLLELVKLEGLNPNQFYIKTGLANGFLNTVGEKLRKPSIEKIEKTFPRWNIDYLIKGEGEKYKDTTKTPYTPNAHIIENIEYVNIPLVPVRARCGYLSSFGDQQYIDSLPTIPVIIDRAYHGRYMVFEADGDSMDDGSSSAIRDGDKLLCREVQRHLWLPKLHYNDWYFVVVHKTEGISIKQIIDQDEQGNIRCHSLNPLFNDYTLNLDDVSELYNVVKVVERSMRL